MKKEKKKLSMENYNIEKDKILNCWIVWEKHPNYSVDIYHGKLKRDCKQWLEGLINGHNNKQHN